MNKYREKDLKNWFIFYEKVEQIWYTLFTLRIMTLILRNSESKYIKANHEYKTAEQNRFKK